MQVVGNKTHQFVPKTERPAAIVVTYNRKQLLVQAIEALLKQTRQSDLIIVDNASTDGTHDRLNEFGFIDHPQIHYVRLPENIGGSGGFSEGLSYAMAGGWHWFWMMDDDAIPEPDALENLMKFADDPGTVYGSAAINWVGRKEKLCWSEIVIRNGCSQYVEEPEMLQDIEEVDMIPFLGFFIHRDIVQRIGYPDRDFFICADDKEYCERAKRHGIRVYLVKSSVIRHPLSKSSIHDLFGFQAVYRSLPPWKVYYDVRNKLLIARKYYGYKVWTQTLPGIIIRALIGIAAEKQRALVLRMHLKAIVDGFTGRKGRRVRPLAS